MTRTDRSHVVSPRLDAIVRRPIHRSYLEGIDGYWADLVIQEFEFLEQRGGTLDAVLFHQKGDVIIYYGPWGKVTLEFAPDNDPGGQISAEAFLRGANATFEGDLNQLVRLRNPQAPHPPEEPIDREAIALRVRIWADVLRTSTDLFDA